MLEGRGVRQGLAEAGCSGKDWGLGTIWKKEADLVGGGAVSWEQGRKPSVMHFDSVQQERRDFRPRRLVDGRCRQGVDG